MNILLVGNFLSASTGVRGVCEDLAERLAASGHTILVTSLKKNRVARLLDMVTTVWRERSNYKIAQVDLYSGPSFFWAEIVCLLLRRIGKPYILTLHGGRLPEFGRRWPGRVERLLATAAVVTTPSRYLLEQMQPYRSDLRLLSNPLNLSAYHFTQRTVTRPRLVWLRAFHSIYNPTLVPRVLAALAPKFPEIQLTMIGPDKGDGSLEQVRSLATELGVAGRLTLCGAVPKTEVPHRLAQGDIFLNATNVDNTPVTVMEAMACGLCVVSTNVGGMPYLLEDNHDALLVPPDNSTAMAAAVERLLTEADLARRLSENARRKAEQFAWPVILPQWESLFAEVAREEAL